MPKLVFFRAIMALIAVTAVAQDDLEASAATAAVPIKVVEPGDYPVSCEWRCWLPFTRLLQAKYTLHV
jgi:hypothetical protein